MREVENDFQAAGINVRFIVIGTPEVAQEFCERFGDPSRCVADPAKRTYAAMGLGRYNFLRMFSDRALSERRKANNAAGFRQNWSATRIENGAQLPGAAFFDASGTLQWMHRGSHPGDLPPMREMLERLRGWRTVPSS